MVGTGNASTVVMHHNPTEPLNATHGHQACTYTSNSWSPNLATSSLLLISKIRIENYLQRRTKIINLLCKKNYEAQLSFYRILSYHLRPDHACGLRGFRKVNNCGFRALGSTSGGKMGKMVVAQHLCGNLNRSIVMYE